MMLLKDLFAGKRVDSNKHFSDRRNRIYRITYYC